MKTKIVSFENIKKYFSHIFDEPKTTEIYVHKTLTEYTIEFHMRGYYIKTIVTIRSLMDELKKELQDANRDFDSDSVNKKLKEFEGKYLRFGIPARDEEVVIVDAVSDREQ